MSNHNETYRTPHGQLQDWCVLNIDEVLGTSLIPNAIKGKSLRTMGFPANILAIVLCKLLPKLFHSGTLRSRVSQCKGFPTNSGSVVSTPTFYSL